MTQKYILATVMLLAAGYVSAQNKLSPAAIALMEEYKEAPASRGETPEVFAIVTLNNASEADQLEALGLEITDNRNGHLLVHIPMDKMEEVAALECVKSISFGQMAYPMMDRARATSKVDEVHTGTNLPRAYTGAGIVTGLFDTGLDVEHINFMKDGDPDDTRVLAAAKVNNGRPSTMTTYDTKDESHGTHVLGIMAGSYKGDVKYAGTTGANPYYGVATGSDIVMTGGTLLDANILAGVKYVIDNAKEVGEPAVVNLSIGSTVGTHDGTSDFNRTLDEYGKDAIIVMSAGNEAQTLMGVGKTFTANDKSFTTSFYPVEYQSNAKINNISGWDGTLEFYASDDRPFTVRIQVMAFDTATPELLDEYVISSSTSGKSTYVGGSPNSLTAYEPLVDWEYAVGNKAYIKALTNVNTVNNCYYANLSFTQFAIDKEVTGTVVAVTIEGQEGQSVRGYANSGNTTRGKYTAQFSNRGYNGWMSGEANGTINDMACGKNVIVVGSYNTRNTWPVINSNRTVGIPSYIIGDISEFSSYGTLADGRNLPHICAPGAFIMSSYNSYYIDAKGMNDSNSDLGAMYTDKYGLTHYWGRMQGTSMSSPFAAGVFALWLEANPTLDVNAIRDIAKRTAMTDRYTQAGDPVQWGAGKLGAYEGLKLALNYTSSVNDVLADKSIIYQEVSPGVYDVFAQGARKLNAALYSLSGVQAASASADGDNLTLSAEGLSAGVYVLRIDADGNTQTHKVVVK